MELEFGTNSLRGVEAGGALYDSVWRRAAVTNTGHYWLILMVRMSHQEEPPLLGLCNFLFTTSVVEDFTHTRNVRLSAGRRVINIKTLAY